MTLGRLSGRNNSDNLIVLEITYSSMCCISNSLEFSPFWPHETTLKASYFTEFNYVRLFN